MPKTGSLTRNPTLLTAVLSIAALAGYAAYRLTVGTLGSQTTAESAEAIEHEHPAQPADGLANSLPDVELGDLAGTPTALSTFTGQPLVINFWATWCVPCRREIPMLKTFHDEHDSITVLGIAVDDRDAVLSYAEDMQFNYPVLIGQAEGMNAAAALGTQVIALPLSVFTDADGAILAIHTGELHAEQLESFAATVAELDTGVIDRAEARERLADL